MTDAPRDRVLLLHGIAASSASLNRLERAIAAAGYEPLNLSYPSRTMPIEHIVDWRHTKQVWIAQPDGQTHILAYSMGALVARAYVAQYRPACLGRMVMIGPPNGGSEVADLLAGFAFYRRVFGPAGLQLTTRLAEMLSRSLGVVDYPLGIIAGDRAIDPFAWLVIPRPNDGRVSVARTRLVGMADHITIHATHFGMMRSREAAGQTLHFLQHGHFVR